MPVSGPGWGIGADLRFVHAAVTDSGRVRTSNEDACKANPDLGLFLVADGMGGHAAGEVASEMAAETVEERLARAAGPESGVQEVLRAAFTEANLKVHQAQFANAELQGMGCTMTALWFRHNRYHIAHVGDSRAYCYRDGELTQLTRDHSLVWDLLEKGILRKEDLSSHPRKNLITRSIGPNAGVEADLEQGEARAGDVFLLCSDGLTDVVPDSSIGVILGDPELIIERAGERLISAANEAGGPDNVTVVLVKLLPDAD